MKKFINAACKKQREILHRYGFDCEEWTVQEASLAIKRIAENGWIAPEGMTIETIDNDYEFVCPKYNDDGTIGRFSRGISIEGLEGTYTVVDCYDDYDGETIYELESDNYGYVETFKKVTPTTTEHEIIVGHIIADKNRNVLAENMDCDFFMEHEFRKCSECGRLMVEGFYVDYLEYYCTEECLHKHYTEEEYEQMYEDDYAYWTQWY